VEEAWVRANEAFPLYEVLKKLALGDQKGTLEEYI
jgi:hypothetical protein